MQDKIMINKDLIVWDKSLALVPSLTDYTPKYEAKIDMGGFVAMVNKTYTDEQIQHIKEYFGWIVTNL